MKSVTPCHVNHSTLNLVLFSFTSLICFLLSVKVCWSIMSVENVAAPPPPPPPPPSLARSVSSKKKLYQALAEGRAPVEGDHEEARIILGQRESR